MPDDRVRSYRGALIQAGGHTTNPTEGRNTLLPSRFVFHGGLKKACRCVSVRDPLSCAISQ